MPSTATHNIWQSINLKYNQWPAKYTLQQINVTGITSRILVVTWWCGQNSTHKWYNFLLCILFSVCTLEILFWLAVNLFHLLPSTGSRNQKMLTPHITRSGSKGRYMKCWNNKLHSNTLHVPYTPCIVIVSIICKNIFLCIVVLKVCCVSSLNALFLIIVGSRVFTIIIDFTSFCHPL